MKRAVDLLVRTIPTNNRMERIWKIAQVDFQSRYYNDRLGLLWALIKPLFEVALYYVVFTHFFKVEIQYYGIYLFGGVVLWMVFAETTTRGMYLLADKLYLIDNIQFNHIDIYLSHVFSTFFAFFFNFLVFVAVAIGFGAIGGVDIFSLLVVIITLFLLCLSTTMILSSFQPFFKDLAHLWDMIVMTGFWTSGILYKSELILDGARWYAFINPMVGTIMNGRAAIMINDQVDPFWLTYNLAFSIIFTVLGFWVFKNIGALAVEKI